jgi:pimeloyl-ACP methyl ester carboxylesterase
MNASLRIAAAVAGSSLTLYSLLMVVAYFGQQLVLYPAPANPIEPRFEGARLEGIAGPDGATIYALYAPASPGRPTVVHFHGNGEDIAGQGWLFHAMKQAGIGVFAVEYPGYGPAKGGAISEASVYATAENALQHLYELGVSRSAVVLQGQSLGTGVAAEMAHRGHGARLVLISPYTSMVDMARRVAPFLPVRWLLRDRYETARKAPLITLPALVIHGTDDELIPFEMGKHVAALLAHGEFYAVRGGHHADLFYRDDRALVAKLVAFVAGETHAER